MFCVWIYIPLCSFGIHLKSSEVGIKFAVENPVMAWHMIIHQVGILTEWQTMHYNAR
jgi:hypothetical protein